MDVIKLNGWLVAVSDSALTRIPWPAVGRDPAQDGFGLSVVAMLSRALSWTRRVERKTVWAWMDRGVGGAPPTIVPVPRPTNPGSWIPATLEPTARPGAGAPPGLGAGSGS